MLWRYFRGKLNAIEFVKYASSPSTHSCDSTVRAPRLVQCISHYTTRCTQHLHSTNPPSYTTLCTQHSSLPTSRSTLDTSHFTLAIFPAARFTPTMRSACHVIFYRFIFPTPCFILPTPHLPLRTLHFHRCRIYAPLSTLRLYMPQNALHSRFPPLGPVYAKQLATET